MNGDKKSWTPLIILAITAFFALLGSTVLNVAITPLVRELHTNIHTIQIIIASYSLTMGSIMLLTGKLQDLLGKRTAFITVSVIFSTGSLISAFSFDAITLFIGYSLLQGIGSAFMGPSSASF